MAGDPKKEEGSGEKTTTKHETVKVELSSDNNQSDEPLRKEGEGEGKTLKETEEEKQKDEKIKNLWALVIILAGALLGSLFVDVAQFITKSGYSARALKKTRMFVEGGRTWVAYSEPPVKIKILGVSQEEQKKCPKCDPTDVLNWLRKFMPTITAEKVDLSSNEGKKLAEDFQLKTVPAFVFDNAVKETDFYSNGQARTLFEEKNGSLVLNVSGMGIPVGKYLETPTIADDDPVIGNKDAKVKIVIFSDFQCPYCKMFFGTVTALAKEFGDQVVLAYKDMPLEFHPQAMNAALAAQCAREQGKFWEMGKLLYDNQKAWGDASKGKDVFKLYADQLGLNIKQFNDCLESEKYKDKIQKDKEEGQNFGISGTPGGFVGEQFVAGAIKEDNLRQMIEDELHKNDQAANQSESDKQ
jgi:protein-disulfide isomerase